MVTKNDQISQTQWAESDFIYLTKKLKSVAKNIVKIELFLV